MLARLTAVSQDIDVLAAGLFESVGQDRQAVEGTVIVNGPSEFHDGAFLPPEDGGVRRGGPEGVTENIPKKVAFSGFVGFYPDLRCVNTFI
jgi:hypothetical protein